MLKKRFLICLVLLVALLVANFAMIQAASSADLTFTLNEDGTGYIVSDCKTTASGSLSIPSKYNGKPVVEIGREAFLGCTKLTSITSFNNVKTIGWYAFSGCTGLTSVTIPNTVTAIDWFAFSGCTGLTSVTVGTGVTSIDASVFAGCTNLSSVTIGNGATSIGWSSFKGCTNLSSVSIPGGVESIDRYAFYDCDQLSSVTYCGTEEEWDAITKGDGNTALSTASLTLHKYEDGTCSLCGDKQAGVAQNANVTVTTSADTYHRGETVTVTVSTTAVDYCAVGGFLFSYDTAAFEYVSGSALVSGFTSAGIDTENGNVAGYFMNGNETVQGDIFQITLKVKEDAEFGSYTITGTPSFKAEYDDAEIDVICSVNTAAVSVTCGHSMKATNNGDGTHTVACSVCGTVENASAAHNFVDGTCANGCGAVEEPEIVKVDFIAASQVIMGNNMDMMFAINKSIVSDWTGYYAEIVHIYADGRENDVQRIYSEDFGTSGKYYTVTYKGLAAKEMCDKLIVTIYNEKGQAVSNDWVDSLKEYAQRNYNVTTNLSAAKLAAKRTMIVDMLNYGAAAQIKAGYGLDLLANAGLTPEQQAVGTQEVTLESNVNNTHMASQLMLESNISFWIAIKNLDETMSAKIEYTDYLGKTKVESISGENFGISGSVRYVASTQVVMADAYQVLNITIYNADGSIFTTTQDSIQAYLARSIDKATEENKPLYEGIMKFATSARTYLLTD